MTDVCIALMTAPTMDVAQKIVRSAVENGIAACGNIVPQVISLYKWQEEIQTDAEVLVIFKTTSDRFASLVEHVRESHPYEIPEVLQVAVTQGHAPYLEWVRQCVMSGGVED